MDICRVSKPSGRLQRFDAFRAGRHVPRGLKGLIRLGFAIVRPLRRAFDVHGPS
jgi:hypothetical protein